MALFPATKYPEFGYRAWFEENVVRSEARSPYFQEKDVWGGLLRWHAAMRFNLRTDDVLAVFVFWKQNRRVTFDFIDYDDDAYILDTFRDTGTRNKVDLASGAATYEVRAKTLRNVTVYVAGVATAAYTMNDTGIGNDGMARVTFNAGSVPAAGQQLRISYTGHRLFRGMRFLSAPIPESVGRGRKSLPVEVFQDLRLADE